MERQEAYPDSKACFLIFLVILIAVLLPRLAAIGDFPHMDEGYHDFMARYIQQSYENSGKFPADLIGYKLYNFLFYWVYYLPGNGTIWLRLVDLSVASGCCYVFCVLLCRESGSLWAGLLLGASFFTAMNVPQAIDSGFKNSFFPSFLCLFSAFNLVSRAKGTSRRWFAAGALTALGIIFRETFIPFPVIACAGLLVSRNLQALWRYITGGIICGILLTLLLMLLRDQIWGIFQFYLIYGKIYGPESGRRWLKFVQNGSTALYLFWPLLLLAIGSIWSLRRTPEGFWKSRACFWLACSVAPLLEPLSKIGFLYHFSACLPGMAGLCAYAFDRRKEARRWWLGGFGATLILMQFTIVGHYEKWPTTRATLANWPAAAWPGSLADKSTTLEAAKKIREMLPEKGTVGSTGFAYFIFPASNHPPSEMSLADLSRTWIYSGYNPETFRAWLDQNPPDAVLLAFTNEDHSATFFPELDEIFSNHPGYEYVGKISPDPKQDYGWLGYAIYRKLSGEPQ